MIHQSVRDYFVAYSKHFEGAVYHLYRCEAERVTISIGCLVDPMPLALAVPFLRKDGSAATLDEVRAEWRLIASAPGLGKKGHTAAAKLCNLHISQATSDALVNQRLEANIRALTLDFPAWGSWQAAAQLAVISGAWAHGTGSPYPKRDAALKALDFVTAANECTIRGNPRRTLAQKTLFMEAARRDAMGLDPAEFEYRVPKS